MNHELDASIAAFNRGDWISVLRTAPELARSSPLAWQALYMKGVALLERYQLAEAVRNLEEACTLNARHPPLLLQLARAYVSMSRQGEAVRSAQAAVDLEPDSALTMDSAGVIFSSCGLHAEAHRAFAAASQLCPDNPGYRYNLATSLTVIGDLTGAECEFEACIRLAPSHWRAHHGLSYLKRQTSTDNHINRLRALLPYLSGRQTATAHIRMALAKELEDIGDYTAAFDEYVSAKSGPRKLIGYKAHRDTELMEALSGLFLEPVPRDRGHSSDRPIFIIGMPRSGTTLVDRILSSHRDVTSIGETNGFAAALKRISGTLSLFDPDSIARLDITRVDWHALGQTYLDSTGYLAGPARRFTEKFPMNFLYAGLIAGAFSNAAIICLHRNPMDTCLSNFRQLFAPESPYYDYSYDIFDTGRYYLQFRKLMERWDRIFPGRILTIQYENLVQDQVEVTERLLDFCRLEWDPNCLQFEKNAAPVATASSVQVRERLHNSSIGHWRNYTTQLTPLREYLRAEGILVSDRPVTD